MIHCDKCKTIIFKFSKLPQAEIFSNTKDIAKNIISLKSVVLIFSIFL